MAYKTRRNTISNHKRKKIKTPFYSEMYGLFFKSKKEKSFVLTNLWYWTPLKNCKFHRNWICVRSSIPETPSICKSLVITGAKENIWSLLRKMYFFLNRSPRSPTISQFMQYFRDDKYDFIKVPELKYIKIQIFLVSKPYV